MNTSTSFQKLMYFLLYYSFICRKRESGIFYLLIYTVYLLVVSSLVLILKNYFLIILFDIIIKIAFSNYLFSNYKYILYLPISIKQKKRILFFKPLISFLNFPIIFFIYNYDNNSVFFILLIILNSYSSLLAKINITKILPFSILYLLLFLLNYFESQTILFLYCLFILIILKNWTYNMTILNND